MGKFIFQMQQLLNIKKQLEKAKENELSIAIKKVETEENLLSDFIEDVKEHISDIRSNMLQGVTVNEIKQSNHYLNHLEKRVLKQQKIVNDVKAIADKVREELIKIAKEREVLEILRQNKFEEYMKEEQKKEELEINEIVGYKYIQQKEGEENDHSTRK